MNAYQDPSLENLAINSANPRQTALLVLLSLFCLFGPSAQATFPPVHPWLDYWPFDNTNSWVTFRGYYPVSFTNVSTSNLGEYWTADLDSTNAAWLQYNITESSGTNELKVDQGSLMFWFAPKWSGTNEGGAGPGEWGRLIEVGAYTTNASYGWWSLYVDPEGANIYFSAQTNNGLGATYLSAPISWDTNRWHHIALTYSETNSSLYLDGGLVTNGLALTYWPGPDVLTNGFYIGSSQDGYSQSHGMFDELYTYDYPVDAVTVSNAFLEDTISYWGNPRNVGNIGESAFSYPSLPPSNFDAVTGPGNLIPISTNSIGCETNSQVWLTNFVATMATNHTMNVTFTIAGGADGSLYDVFANSDLDFSTNRTQAWSWMGQGHHCTTYMLTNLYSSGSFLILGTPLDSDGDGLTDAYERLVSKTNPYLWDTDGDGVSDGIEVLVGTDPLHYDQRGPLVLPTAGSSHLTILAPDLLEMTRVSGDTNTWNFLTNAVTTDGTNFVTNTVVNLPATNQFQVHTPSGLIGVTQIGYKRRPLYASLEQDDFRVENTVYLRLASTNWATSNATVEVTTTNTTLWPATMRFVSVNDPLRYGPNLHVNQQGYLPTYQKKAMIGYYLGNLGEMQISTNLGFKLVDATSGAQVYPTSGLAGLTARPDAASTWPSPAGVNQPQYQAVLEADFSAFTNAGQYQLVVPGLGASYPFRIDSGTMMNLARTYALGLYHQRCGKGEIGLQVNDVQFTRFVHGDCHTNKVAIPLPAASYGFTWTTISNYALTINSNNPPQGAPPLYGPDTNHLLFQFPTTTNSIDVSGGHHDAGDYSKYTVNSAQLIHILIFGADNLGLTNFDNFGLPESANGIPDILDEAKWEADFLLKMQDTNDGGFYFLVYPVDTEYENHELPGNHPQVVWPKTTSATASAVAALAEIGSSRVFGSYFAQSTNLYMQAAIKGWNFLTNAIAKYGKYGCYQKITTYGDDYTHDDELTWAAASLFSATGGASYKSNLFDWYPNPANTNAHNGFTFQWIKDTNSLPGTGDLLVAIKYTPSTNIVITNIGGTNYTNIVGSTNISGPLQFRIFDSTGTKVVDESDTALTNAVDRVNAFKIFLNNQYSDPQPGIPSTFDTIYAIIGFCNETRRYGYLRCYAGYGCALRDYAFAALSGRRLATDLDTNYLAQCVNELTNRAADLRLWSTQNAYGTSLDPQSKGHDIDEYNVGWYFAGDHTFDLAVADRVGSDTNTHLANTNAIIENFNYEAGRNPINVSRLTGVGSYRQREIVDQYARNNPQAVLPPSGIPLGNIASFFDVPVRDTDWYYGYLDPVSFPDNGTGTNTYALYDRWTEADNLNTEFVHLNTARALVSAAYLVNSQALVTQSWRRASAIIVFPNGFPAFSTKCVAQLSTTQDLTGAQIVWDPGSAAWNFLGQDPAFGTNFTFIPESVGDGRTLQAEALLPDGRRIFASTNFSVWDPVNGGTSFPNPSATETNTIALYHFDNTNNPWADATSNHYDLSAGGTVSLVPNANWMASPTGYVARFESAGNYLEVTNISPTAVFSNSSASMTIDLRIYPRAYTGSGATYLLHLYQNPTNSYYREWSIYEDSSTGEIPQIYGPQASVVFGTNLWQQLITPNTWHQIRVTVGPADSGQNQTIVYLDGRPETTNYPPAPFNNSTEKWLLHLGDFNGDLDEVRISNIIRE